MFHSNKIMNNMFLMFNFTPTKSLNTLQKLLNMKPILEILDLCWKFIKKPYKSREQI